MSLHSPPWNLRSKLFLLSKGTLTVSCAVLLDHWRGKLRPYLPGELLVLVLAASGLQEINMAALYLHWLGPLCLHLETKTQEMHRPARGHLAPSRVRMHRARSWVWVLPLPLHRVLPSPPFHIYWEHLCSPEQWELHTCVCLPLLEKFSHLFPLLSFVRRPPRILRQMSTGCLLWAFLPTLVSEGLDLEKERWLLTTAYVLLSCLLTLLWPVSPGGLAHPRFSQHYPKHEPDLTEHPWVPAYPGNRDRRTGMGSPEEEPPILSQKWGIHTHFSGKVSNQARQEGGGKHLHKHGLSCGLHGHVMCRSRALERKGISQAKPGLKDPAQPAPNLVLSAKLMLTPVHLPSLPGQAACLHRLIPRAQLILSLSTHLPSCLPTLMSSCFPLN